MILPGEAVDRVGLIRNDGLGDTLLALPVATALKRFDKEIQVELICRSDYTDLMQAHPDVDAVIGDPGGSAADLARELRLRQYDAVIVLRPTPRNAWAAFRARIPIRVGTAYRAYSLLFTMFWHRHRKKNIRHEVEYNVEMAETLLGRSLGIPQFYLSPPSEEKARAAGILAGEGIDREHLIMALHPGSLGSSLEWPVEHYASLAERLREQRCQVVVTGTPEEKEITERVAAVPGVVDLTGRTTLGELAWIYKFCDTVISNSTGTLHLAAAVGTKVVGIYPAATINSPVRWGPYGPGHKAFTGPVDNCKKCIREECPVFNCLEMVPVKDVLRVALGVSAQSPHHGRWIGSASTPKPARPAVP
jgi:ADP-heptose:LPS heptosyltransferase